MYLYKIQNMIDKKIYVGITNNIHRRWKEHKNNLRNNKHHNRHLQAAWNLYGKDNFKFKKLNEFNNLDSMKKTEADYISKNNLLNPHFGYNLDPGGSGSFKHTEDAKNRISISKGRSIVSMCLKTGLIKHYNMIIHVKEDGFDPKSIGKACVDKILTHKQHVWMYSEDYQKNPIRLTEKRNARKNVKARPSRYKETFGMNINTKDIISYPATYHSKKDGFSHAAIYKCCTNYKVNKSHKGYVWSFDKNNLLLKRDVVLNNKTHKVFI